MRYNENSLYYRLNSKHLNYLLGCEPSFPFTIGNVLEELRTKSDWNTLSYETICNLVWSTGSSDYSPTTIETLFNNK
jgi:hypothetical protein